MSSTSNRTITDEEIKTIVKLKKAGKTYKQIEDETNIPPHKTMYYVYKAIHGVHPRAKVKLKKPEKVMTENIVIPVSKPMIALVGTPAEITATIKELFS
jgi:hypothetical protein